MNHEVDYPLAALSRFTWTLMGMQNCLVWGHLTRKAKDGHTHLYWGGSFMWGNIVPPGEWGGNIYVQVSPWRSSGTMRSPGQVHSSRWWWGVDGAPPPGGIPRAPCSPGGCLLNHKGLSEASPWVKTVTSGWAWCSSTVQAKCRLEAQARRWPCMCTLRGSPPKSLLPNTHSSEKNPLLSSGWWVVTFRYSLPSAEGKEGLRGRVK